MKEKQKIYQRANNIIELIYPIIKLELTWLSATLFPITLIILFQTTGIVLYFKVILGLIITTTLIPSFRIIQELDKDINLNIFITFWHFWKTNLLDSLKIIISILIPFCYTLILLSSYEQRHDALALLIKAAAFFLFILISFSALFIFNCAAKFNFKLLDYFKLMVIYLNKYPTIYLKLLLCLLLAFVIFILFPAITFWGLVSTLLTIYSLIAKPILVDIEHKYVKK